MSYLATYFTNLSVVWIINRRIMRNMEFRDEVTDILACTIHDAMRGVVDSLSARLDVTDEFPAAISRDKTPHIR